MVSAENGKEKYIFFKRFCFVIGQIDCIFAAVMKMLPVILLSLAMSLCAKAQSDRPGHINPEDMEVDMDSPTLCLWSRWERCYRAGIPYSM